MHLINSPSMRFLICHLKYALYFDWTSIMTKAEQQRNHQQKYLNDPLSDWCSNRILSIITFFNLSETRRNIHPDNKNNYNKIKVIHTSLFYARHRKIQAFTTKLRKHIRIILKRTMKVYLNFPRAHCLLLEIWNLSRKNGGYPVATAVSQLNRNKSQICCVCWEKKIQFIFGCGWGISGRFYKKSVSCFSLNLVSVFVILSPESGNNSLIIYWLWYDIKIYSLARNRFWNTYWSLCGNRFHIELCIGSG